MEQHQYPNQLYRTITEQIAAAIAAGAPRFEMPWHRTGLVVGLPVNALTGNAYNGINILALWVAAQVRGFRTGTWATYRQWTELKWQVRKGERGTVIVFYRKIERMAGADDPREDGEPDIRLAARASWVFNADQIDNWRDPEPEQPSPFEVIERAETFVRTIGGGRPGRSRGQGPLLPACRLHPDAAAIELHRQQHIESCGSLLRHGVP